MSTSNAERAPSRPFGCREVEAIVETRGEGEESVRKRPVMYLEEIGSDLVVHLEYFTHATPHPLALVSGTNTVTQRGAPNRGVREVPKRRKAHRARRRHVVLVKLLTRRDRSW